MITIPSLRIVARLLLGGIAFLVAACASGHHPPFEQPLPQVRDLARLEKRIQATLSASSCLSVRKIGAVDYTGFHAPIWCVSLNPKQPVSHTILISAGIHGNEPAGVEYVLELLQVLAGNPNLYPGVAFDIIPVVNPWGWAHNIRFNCAGIDINRDFAKARSQEAAIIQAFVRDTQWHLMLDLHEDPAATGFYVYQYAMAEKNASAHAVAALEKLGYPIEENVTMVILKTDHGIIDAPMMGLWYMQLTDQLSITNYYRLNNSQRVFTIETPTSLPMADRVTMQGTAVQTLIHEALYQK